MLPRNRQKQQSLSYAPDDILSSIYSTTSAPYHESTPNSFKTLKIHPKFKNFRAEFRNFNARKINFEAEKLKLGEFQQFQCRRAAERFARLQAGYKELNLSQKSELARAENQRFSKEVGSKYGRYEVFGLDLPFVCDNEVCRVVMGKK